MKSIVLLEFIFLASVIASPNPPRHSIVNDPNLFQSLIKGNQHVIIALGNKEGDRLFAEGRDGYGGDVRLHKPDSQNEPDPHEVWLLEPCIFCPPNIYKIKHLQSDKYLAISPEVYNKYFHRLTLFESTKNYTTNLESPLMPYTLDDLKIYWEISPMGSYIRNVYYNEYLIPEKSPRSDNDKVKTTNDNDKGGNDDKGNKNQRGETRVLYTGSKLDRDSYWLTFPKSALLYTPPPTPVNPNPGVQPNPPYPGAYPQPPYPGAQPQPPYPGAYPQPPYPGAQPQPAYPGAYPQPSYPGVQPQPAYPGAQSQPSHPGPRPPYPNAQPLPYPNNQQNHQYPK